MIQFIIENKITLLSLLLAISEALALIPALKANGILDLVIKVCQDLLKKPELK